MSFVEDLSAQMPDLDETDSVLLDDVFYTADSGSTDSDVDVEGDGDGITTATLEAVIVDGTINAALSTSVVENVEGPSDDKEDTENT
jgi:hypothetical protein